MKFNTTRRKLENVFNKNETDGVTIGRLSDSKDVTLRNLKLQKASLNLIRKLQTHSFDEITFTAITSSDYDFENTFVSPTEPRIIPIESYEYGLQLASYTLRLENVPYDMIYSVKYIEFVDFGSLQEYKQNPITYVYEPTGRLLEVEDLFNLPELATTVFRTKPLFEVEEIENSSFINLTINGHVIIDSSYLENNITEASYMNLLNSEFMNFHKMNVNLFIGRSLYFK